MKDFRGIILLLLIVVLSAFTSAQVRPIYDLGAIGLGQKLKRIANTKRIMHIGAHPDDEDSDLLAYLARKENARTVYLSLTRGDGGQNVIGPELFEALGIIRTEELLQARRLDGAEQMFTRAFDYGYSKTLAEARAKWDEEEIKCDIVRAIRQFRPQVVNPRFSGTPRDGHGHHQFAGYIAPIAVRAAADPTQCKDAGPPWKVSKFYVGQGFRDVNEPSLRMNTGEYDFLIGRSYYEIAAQGRSQHKSQEQGGTELKGDRFSGVNLVESDLVVRGAEDSMFDGLDTSWRSLGEKSETKGRLAEIQKRFEAAASALKLTDTGKASDLLIRTHRELSALDGLTDKEQARIRGKVLEIEDAILLASGIQIEALSGSETVTPEESLGVEVKVFYPEDSGVRNISIGLDAPEGWDPEEGTSGPRNESPRARFFRESPRIAKSFVLSVPMFMEYTQPYFLRQPRKNYMYHWESDGNMTLPFQPALVSAVVTAEISGATFTFRKPVEYRFADDTRGELRRNLNVVPKVSVKLAEDLVVVPTSNREQVRNVSLNVRSHSSGTVSGTIALGMPDGWKLELDDKSFEIKKKGGSVSFKARILIPPKTPGGSYKVSGIAKIGEKPYASTMNTVRYDHIQTHRFYTLAETKVVVADLKVAPVKVGYVMGSGDSGPDALRQMGLEVELLDDSELTSGDLSRFDTIVVGIRASETNESFISNNQRLLEYVRNGGTMIVQYQKFPFQRLNLAPYPIRFNARVSEEDAPVKILEPGHPVFNYPNKISQKDFEGWVQERNLYALRSFDKRYTPLLESHDTGEPENKGGMVYTRVGQGKYMYVSYAFFRQLPAGVPGAYRLFANIVSLGHKETATP